MEVLQLPTQLFRNSRFTVVMRRHTLDLADAALDHLRLLEPNEEEGPAVLLTGSPGIGKTEAFFIALLRGLLRGEAGPAPPVIFVDRRSTGLVIKLTFDFENGAVSVKSALSMDGRVRASDPDLKLSSTVLIVDPTKEDPNGGGSPPNVAARTVVIASPNIGHYKQFVTRVPEPVTLCMRHWTLAELLVARPHMCPGTNEETLVKRWVKQGGVPRSLVSDAQYARACTRTTTTITSLPFEVVEQLYKDPRMANLAEGGDTAPKSAVLTYVESEKPFTEPKMGFLSRWVETAVMMRLRARLMHLIRTADSDECVKFGHVFERVALMMLRVGGTARVGYLPNTSGECSLCVLLLRVHLRVAVRVLVADWWCGTCCCGMLVNRYHQVGDDR
jgi:hypothetical protein